jgi:hypothetical protein
MINKWTILLLFLVIVGGGIYLIPKIKTTETVQYEKIEKQDCAHYKVTLASGFIYHGYVEQINKDDKTVVIESFGMSLLRAFTWAVLAVYVILQILVWGSNRYFFVTDFFKDWWECSHRLVPEEHKQAFRNFFGYP